jgi:phosphoribosylanthranilate isomerase
MSSEVLVKICGNTSVTDAQMTACAGADYLGVIVEHAPSPRGADLKRAGDIFAATHCPTVAVTVNLPLDRLLRIAEALQPAALQLHGDESPALVRQLKAHGLTVWAACTGEPRALRRRALELTGAGADAVLVDARAMSASGDTVYGGTGHLGDWRSAHDLVAEGLRVILAGGLDADNVAAAIRAVQPWMVDVVSGVEAGKGMKDPHKVRRFIEAARHV